MNNRYFARVVQIIDPFTIVIDRGHNEVKEEDMFLVVGLGDVIKDPESGEELERLELVRGKVKVFHIQEKITTLKSCEYQFDRDRKEIKKVKRRGTGLGLTIFDHFPGEETIETIEPGEKQLIPLRDAAIGDYVIKL